MKLSCTCEKKKKKKKNKIEILNNIKQKNFL